MAAEAVLSAFMQSLFEKLMAAALDEFRLLRGVRREMQSLTITLSAIQALLEDADEKQLKDKSVRLWLAQFKDVAYDIDDLLDECAAKKLRSEIENPTRWKVQVSGCFTGSCLRGGSYRGILAHRIRSIQGRLDKIARQRDNLGLQLQAGTIRRHSTARPQTSSLVDDRKVFGREKDREAIVRMLLLSTNNPNQNVTILPIVGMGGLGKTTLAQSVYNDDRVKQHFQLRMWVCVTENFDETKLAKDTLESATRHYHTTTFNTNLLQENLFEEMQGKRFLLVLDDVWNEDPIKWDRYRIAILAGDRGSRVIVTTQNENVGRIMGGSPPYQLKQLTDADCWDLFKSYAFVDGNSSTHPNLENIGKMIVKKLKGLPLSAKAIGSLLYSKLDEEVWKNILKSEIWELPTNKNNILPALRLSYEYLPPNLKQCFAFCSVYHKDFAFDKHKLIKIWAALGFIVPERGNRMEDTGGAYFDELVSRSFFQPHKGNYVMHDAIHDLALSLSVEECHRLDDDSGVGYACPQKIRHLSFSCANAAETSFEKFFQFEKLRTLMLLRGYKSRTTSIPDDLFLRLRYLRVLDLRRRDIHELPNSIGNLIQLRYLDLSGTDLSTLPQSVSKLYNLQTLILSDCNSLTKIPDGITNLVNLRHLETTTSLISEITGLGGLTALQDLRKFIVRKDEGFTITELKDMKELRGHLCIQNLENVVSMKEASEAKLSAKEGLSFLSLEWTTDRYFNTEEEEFLDAEVIEALRPHVELKELKIMGYAGTKFPSWMGNPSFCYLETIHLYELRRCKFLPPLGQLPLLRYLDIGDIHGLVSIGQEFCGKGDISGFPSLIELLLDDMPDLEEWICFHDDGMFPSLTELGIVDCPKLRELPPIPPTVTRLRVSQVGLVNLPELHGSSSLLSSLSDLNIYGCPNLVSLQQGLLGQQLSALEKLAIIDCGNLILLPPKGFQDLASLKTLSIYASPNLVPLEDGRNILPTALKELRIKTCSKLIKDLLTEAKDLTSLQLLQITDCTDLYYFPEEGIPLSLEFLGIFNCYNLQLLPANLNELTSLKTMVINNCQQVQRLPEKGLPMNLQEMYIYRCQLLKDDLVDGAADCNKLTHVPRIVIDGSIIRKSSDILMEDHLK